VFGGEKRWVCGCALLCCSASFGGPEEETVSGAPGRAREEEEEVSSSAAATPMASDAGPTEFSTSEAYRFTESWDTFSPPQPPQPRPSRCVSLNLLSTTLQNYLLSSFLALGLNIETPLLNSKLAEGRLVLCCLSQRVIQWSGPS